ncbi:hypothetical protein P389DRAFT_188865 [Cystobasidium minutum MCA 4210]|uniref:uncharacterized protein n=1 Tax=Cystobasidium minutum MCA 4210 TaxID=1397322 RepID=UPI0034CE2A5D|eukprot:jgi/Rhomi1/188865/estExt_fgenesh1_pg.C_3_t10282
MSVDAKLAAQAAAAAAGGMSSTNNPSARAPSSSSSNSNTPKVQQAQAQSQSQQQQQVQHHHPAAVSQFHPHHHHQRSKKEEYLLMSLPSNDSTLLAHHNHHHHWESGENNGFYGGSDEGEDSDWTEATMCPPLTNRGNKLAPGARFVRKGRLGGWENREFFDGVSQSTSSKLGFKGGASSSSKPTISGEGTADALLADEVKRPQNGLPGGKDVYPITPNLTFVPSSSTAAARPDREAPAYSFLPGPNSPTSPSALSPRKRKKVYSSYTGLASTSGSTSNHTSAPVRAYLPAPPQNPIELVMSPLVTRTFSPRNNSLEKLALHPTDLIERDLPLLKALTRVVDVLRGTTVAGLDGSIGLPFSNDNEPVIQADIKDKAVEEAEHEIEAEIKNAKEAEAEYLHSKHDKKADANPTATAVDEGGMQVDKQQQNGAETDGPPPKRRRTASMEVETADASATAAQTNGTDATPATASSAAPVVNSTAVDASVGTATVAAAETAEVEMQEDAAKPTDVAALKHDSLVNGTEAVKLEASLKGLAQPSSSVPEKQEKATDKTAEQAMSSNEAVHDKAESGAVAAAAVETTPTVAAAAAPPAAAAAASEAMATSASTAAPASVAASRRNTPFSAIGEGEDDNVSMADTAAEGSTSSSKQHNPSTRLPASLQRIANPAPYVSSLFVTPRDVLVGIPPGAPGSMPGQPNAPVPGGYQWIDILLPNGTPRFVYRNPPKAPGQQQQPEASTSASASGSTSTATEGNGAPNPSTSANGANQARNSSPVSTYPEYRKLTPAEQQEAVHLCTQELTKFLSDTLEYRDRLGEIRDSILGVEKRRKGVWTMARSYAHQLLWEEEQDRIANGM